ncbi:hypothetical protein DRQ50_08995, partial [bacterium]
MRPLLILLSVTAILILCSGCSDDDPTAPLSTAREITTFRFLAADNAVLAVDVTAAIAGTEITAVVPEGTDLTALVATFSTTGETVRIGSTDQISGATANDFSSLVAYTVVAADASTGDYTVSVTELDSDKEITAFRFLAADNTALAVDVTATMVGTEIAAVVPDGTDLTALVATFTTTGETVRVGSIDQVSGVTVNDFSGPVTYTVVGADASTQDYGVTVTASTSMVWFGDYIIRNANDMAAISGYTEITGYLRVFSDLTNLDGLSSLTTIGGFLEVLGNDALVDLDGLSALTAVGSYVEIAGNDALQVISGLGNLATVPVSLSLGRNPSLTSLTGLERVTSLGSGAYDVGLEIWDNDALVNLTGLDNLVSVGGSVDIGHNDLLVSVAGLGNLATVGVELMVVNNPVLATLAHLTSLTSLPVLVVGTHYYGGNTSLVSVDIPALESVGSLIIENNFGLVDLAGLTALADIVDLHVYQNPVLTTFGFGATAATPLELTGFLEVYDNPLLEDLDGLDATTAMTGWVRLVDNASLATVAALDGLTTLGGYLQIGAVEYDGHPDLENLGFGALTTIGGHLTIADNDHTLLTSPAFGNLQTVAGSITVWGNANVRDMAGFANLTVVTGNLIIGENRELWDLSALDGVTSIEGALVIDTNDKLDALFGLGNVTTIQGNLEIRDNLELD